MTKLEFITVSLGVFGLGIIYSYVASKETEKTIEKSKPRTEHYEYEDLDSHHKMKVFKHKTWYGDTMLVTVDTTYYFYSE
jgi:hypothetical protein